MDVSQSIAAILARYRYDLPESATDTMHNITADIADLFHKLDPRFNHDEFMQQAL